MWGACTKSLVRKLKKLAYHATGKYPQLLQQILSNVYNYFQVQYYYVYNVKNIKLGATKAIKPLTNLCTK